jgi:hypothetical protein
VTLNGTGRMTHISPVGMTCLTYSSNQPHSRRLGVLCRGEPDLTDLPTSTLPTRSKHSWTRFSKARVGLRSIGSGLRATLGSFSQRPTGSVTGDSPPSQRVRLSPEGNIEPATLQSQACSGSEEAVLIWLGGPRGPTTQAVCRGGGPARTTRRPPRDPLSKCHFSKALHDT